MIVHVNGIDLEYEDTGSGTPLLLIHGFPHTYHLWDAQRSGLQGTEHSIRLITPNLRGFGGSEVRGPYSMAQYADDIAELLSQLDIPQVVLGGLSMGGYIVFEFWRRYPHMVRALILADTRCTADTAEAREKRKALIALAQEQGANAVAENQLTGMVGATTRESRPEVVERLRAMLSAQPVEGIVGALSAMMERPDSTPTLSTIDVPTLVVVGDEDVITPVKDARAIHASIPGSVLTVIPQAGHVSCMEVPAQFNAAVVDFFSKFVA
jgi:3-oxoadipate enol-lactonase